jgi:hypothetical protein
MSEKCESTPRVCGASAARWVHLFRGFSRRLFVCSSQLISPHLSGRRVLQQGQGGAARWRRVPLFADRADPDRPCTRRSASWSTASRVSIVCRMRGTARPEKKGEKVESVVSRLLAAGSRIDCRPCAARRSSTSSSSGRGRQKVESVSRTVTGRAFVCLWLRPRIACKSQASGASTVSALLLSCLSFGCRHCF